MVKIDYWFWEVVYLLAGITGAALVVAAGVSVLRAFNVV